MTLALALIKTSLSVGTSIPRSSGSCSSYEASTRAW